MEREWKKLSNMYKYGQIPAYKRNVLLEQTEKNRPPKPPPPPPNPPPPQPPGRGEGVVLSVHVEPDNAGRTSPRDGEVHRYEKNSIVTVQQRPNKNYTFDHWVLDGTLIPAAVAPARIAADGESGIDVLMDMYHTIFAVFLKGPEPPPPPPPPPPPEKKPKIIVKANVKKVQAWIDGIGDVTTFSKQVDPDTDHDIEVEEEVIRGTKKYKFWKWSDGFTDPERKEPVEKDNL